MRIRLATALLAFRLKQAEAAPCMAATGRNSG
jgi:hypothetical protein